MPLQPSHGPRTSATRGQRLKFSSAEAMAQYIVEADVALVDAVVCDPLGRWHHFTFAPLQCHAEELKVGFSFDSSSMRCLGTTDSSEMLMIPDPTACWIDPFCKHRTLHVLCNIFQQSGEPLQRCPRYIAQKAAQAVVDLGIADYCLFGPEPEFFVFDRVRINLSDGEIATELDGEEVSWRNSRRFDVASPRHDARGSTRKELTGARLQKRQMYCATSPTDTMVDLRSDMLLTLRDLGCPIEKHHHEGALCQGELGFRCGRLLETADHVMTYKYVVKNVASLYGKTATFMPKPLFRDNGSGLHVHLSLWSGGTNLFYSSATPEGEGKVPGLSKMALHFLAGILDHSWALTALTNPTTNSYKRLLPGFEAPWKAVYSEGNRSTAIRIPVTPHTNPRAKRIECRFPDGACCPYIAFSALLLAGLDGIVRNLDAPPPVNMNMFTLSPEQEQRYPSLPTSLSEALDALERDHEFLLRRGVFDESFLKAFLTIKRTELRQVESIPHPKEFELYYNV